MGEGGEVTALLCAWREGNRAALDRLIPLVHGDLHRRARHYMRRERPQHTLSPTALVNEAYLRLVDARRVNWRDRAHFLAVAAREMRRVLVEAGRARRSLKRGGGIHPVTFDEAIVGAAVEPDVTVLDEALVALAAEDARKAQVIELRFFGGLTTEETAEVLGVSSDTVMRDWQIAKLWLLRQLKKDRARR
jgi:RNA polymerase sigma factor (TIGR02999 family)